MAPRHRQAQPPDPNQGALIAAEMVGNGATDSKDFRRVGQIIGVNPEGFFPDETSPTIEDAITPEEHLSTEGLKAQMTANRRRAQVGKHSPLQRDGTYLTLMIGDVLPPDKTLGRERPLIVRERDFEYAKRYAAALEKQRLERIKAQPTLDTMRVSDVVRVVADGFDLNRALEAAQAIPRSEEAKPGELPRFNTLQSRLKVIIDEAEQARFVPGSKSEITVALPLIDHGLKPDSPSENAPTHVHLQETEIAAKKPTRAKGYSQRVQAWYADRAVASRCYEMIDFYQDARDSRDALNDFVASMAKLPSDEARKDFMSSGYHPAMGVLLRHITAYQLKDGVTTEEDIFFKPMTLIEDRTRALPSLPSPQTTINGVKITPEELKQAREIIEQKVKLGTGEYSREGRFGRNKTLITPFTNPNMPSDVQRFIHAAVSSMSVDELRLLIPIVAKAQDRRKAFWRTALKDVRGKYKAIVEPVLQGEHLEAS